MKIALRLRDRHVLMWQSLEISNIFCTLTLKQIFWRTQTIFKKLEYRFLVESTEIDNATFPYKTALSEANVKTNKMGSTKWTNQKERSFASNSFLFRKFCLSFRFLPFRRRWSFIWDYFFPVRILNGEIKSIFHHF